jgi:hypothetical protein
MKMQQLPFDSCILEAEIEEFPRWDVVSAAWISNECLMAMRYQKQFVVAAVPRK